MSKLADFLDNYDTLIFDMDGVVTSELNYWNCAALTVYELFNSVDYWGKNKIDIRFIMNNYTDMRKYLFSDDKLISLLKNKGVNSNWDLAYVVICISIILKTPYADKIYEYAQTIGSDILREYDILAEKTARAIGKDFEYCRRGGEIWKMAHLCFQEWFLGDSAFIREYDLYPKKRGKPGLLYDEAPIIELSVLKEIFKTLYENKKRICVGTGRPFSEINEPLKKWDIKKYMAEDGFICYDSVVRAEKRAKDTHLTKPHPYMFLKAMLGKDYPDEKIISKDYPCDKIKRTLVIGDAGADLFAAQKMGADFCAVLTGVQGEAARGFFEENNATYIIKSIAQLLS